MTGTNIISIPGTAWFDNRRNVTERKTRSILPYRQTENDDQPGKINNEAASRFKLPIPLEIRLRCLGCSPESNEDSRLLEPFSRVKLGSLTFVCGHAGEGFSTNRGFLKTKTRYLAKQPFYLSRTFLKAMIRSILAQSLREFLYMEQHTSLQRILLNTACQLNGVFKAPSQCFYPSIIEVGPNLYQFTAEFATLGLDPILR